MYSYEQRKAAVELYIKYFHKAAPVIRELGYPNRHVLVKWFQEYETTGDYFGACNSKDRSKFSNEQKDTVLQFYMAHGKSIKHTIESLHILGKRPFSDG